MFPLIIKQSSIRMLPILEDNVMQKDFTPPHDREPELRTSSNSQAVRNTNRQKVEKAEGSTGR